MRLLDADCAAAGASIASSPGDKKKLANHIDKSLGILVGDGLYAFFLYQKTDTALGAKVVRGLGEMLPHLGYSTLVNRDTPVMEAICQETERLQSILFLRTIIERALVYARYHLKAALKAERQRAGRPVVAPADEGEPEG